MVMLREVRESYLQNRYTADDMVRCGTSDCAGCSHCCEAMGETIVLDPYDIWQLETGLASNFQGLLTKAITLSVYEGIIMPHIMVKEENGNCTFLREDGKCSIHTLRPGFCRLFPLGRLYDEEGLQYILQKEDCPKEPKSKIKVDKWLGIPRIKKYEEYIETWHEITVNLREALKELSEEQAKAVNMRFLEVFYLPDYDAGDFYEQFQKRYERWTS